MNIYCKKLIRMLIVVVYYLYNRFDMFNVEIYKKKNVYKTSTNLNFGKYFVRLAL